MSPLHQRLVKWMQAVPIPETGRVLFVLSVPDDALADDGAESMVADVQRLANEVAPDRAHVAVMTGGLTLDVLTDEQLEPLGLQRIPVSPTAAYEVGA